ncbi:hypothetical protein ACG83_10215 [Frankia sp. R43]|uniref:hypothetical protein n=1 Tax=Frankia sp. R43 TaxID=269536 RepID=UPI0006C9F21C|nr:hypothetical protein [Frankia sp. R43]KPM55656.1 hypothetical protein ACG83_10215 [Frankia sp. R43]
MASERRLEVLRGAREGRLLYSPTAERWGLAGENVSVSARAAVRAGLLAGPPDFFGPVGLTDAGREELLRAEEPDEGEALG